ncbi:MAG TPA: ornithine carbamoyltransferase [Terriglobales bacterium]|nr:ornithine carbamoyltransferase [Terriglobales bacterium]
MTASLQSRDLLSAGDLTRDEYEGVFATAASLKGEFRESRRHEAQPLAGRNVALIFEKQSLRTRVTFEAGLNQLGGHALHLGDGIGFGVRESVPDIAHNLDRWIDGIVIRTFDHSVVAELAAEAGIPVFNALTDEEHPFQALADLLAMREHFGSLEGRVLTFVGDGNNVYHSLALAGATLGMEVRLAHPAGFGPRADIVVRAERLAASSGGKIVIGRDPREIVPGSDALYADVWVSMGQEDQSHTRFAAFAGYCVDDDLLELAGPNAVAMHCLPAHRGQEITAGVLDGPRSLALAQAENRLHVQKAFLVESIGR